MNFAREVFERQVAQTEKVIAQKIASGEAAILCGAVVEFRDSCGTLNKLRNLNKIHRLFLEMQEKAGRK